jgi:hypothetical protein
VSKIPGCQPTNTTRYDMSTVRDSSRTGQPLLIDAKAVGATLGRSERTIRRDDSAARIPRLINLGGSKLWRLKELRQWVRAGCPTREIWESRHGGSESGWIRAEESADVETSQSQAIEMPLIE